MAGFDKGVLLRVSFTDVGPTDRLMMERVLAEMDGVTDFGLSDDGSLTVLLRDEIGEIGLTKAFTVAGMHPVHTEYLGMTEYDPIDQGIWS